MLYIFYSKYTVTLIAINDQFFLIIFDFYIKKIENIIYRLLYVNTNHIIKIMTDNTNTNTFTDNTTSATCDSTQSKYCALCWKLADNYCSKCGVDYCNDDWSQTHSYGKLLDHVKYVSRKDDRLCIEHYMKNNYYCIDCKKKVCRKCKKVCNSNICAKQHNIIKSDILIKNIESYCKDRPTNCDDLLELLSSDKIKLFEAIKINDMQSNQLSKLKTNIKTVITKKTNYTLDAGKQYLMILIGGGMSSGKRTDMHDLPKKGGNSGCIDVVLMRSIIDLNVNIVIGKGESILAHTGSAGFNATNTKVSVGKQVIGSANAATSSSFLFEGSNETKWNNSINIDNLRMMAKLDELFGGITHDDLEEKIDSRPGGRGISVDIPNNKLYYSGNLIHEVYGAGGPITKNIITSCAVHSGRNGAAIIVELV
jgi:hypothetical protein